MTLLGAYPTHMRQESFCGAPGRRFLWFGDLRAPQKWTGGGLRRPQRAWRCCWVGAWWERAMSMFSLVSRLTLAESLKITIAASHVAEMLASQPNQRLHVLGSSEPTAQSR